MSIVHCRKCQVPLPHLPEWITNHVCEFCVLREQIQSLQSENDELKNTLSVFKNKLSNVSDRTGLLEVLKVQSAENLKLKQQLEQAERRGWDAARSNAPDVSTTGIIYGYENFKDWQKSRTDRKEVTKEEFLKDG